MVPKGTVDYLPQNTVNPNDGDDILNEDFDDKLSEILYRDKDDLIFHSEIREK